MREIHKELRWSMKVGLQINMKITKVMSNNQFARLQMIGNKTTCIEEYIYYLE